MKGGEMTDDIVDELGPVDYVVIEFPGSQFNGEIAPVLVDLVDREIIRVLDVLLIHKDEDGSFEAFELSEYEHSDLGEIRRLETDVACREWGTARNNFHGGAPSATSCSIRSRSQRVQPAIATPPDQSNSINRCVALTP
jgi:hypothetical protein